MYNIVSNKMIPTMTKLFSVLILFEIFFSIPVKAQKGESSISLGPSIGIPVNFHTGYKTGFGAGVRAYHGVTKEGSVLVNINYISYATKFTGGPSSATLTCIKVGYKTLFNSNRLFLYGDGGLVIPSGNIGKPGSNVGLGAGLGYSIPAGKSGFIDIAPSFNIVLQSVISRYWLDLHFAYRFSVGKK